MAPRLYAMNTLDYFVQKYNLDLTQKSPIEIPGVSRLDIVRWIRELDFKTGAEVGVYVGEYTSLLLHGNPQLKLWAVDAWVSYDQYTEKPGNNLTFDNIYDDARRRLSGFVKSGKCELVRKYSMDALSDFDDESLDFVYIDANHTAPFVQQDIEGWARKVRRGGIVSGHDYINKKNIPAPYDIIRATNEYTKTHNHTLFILGLKAVEPRVVRERIRSWMFVK